jgi:GR25 family glycosyltransferase involved in LPS biosynthesis
MNYTEPEPKGARVHQWLHAAVAMNARHNKRGVGPTARTFGRDASLARVFVLNLDRQAERWKKFQREAARQRLSNGQTLIDICERVSAVDGQSTPLGFYSPRRIDSSYSLDDFYFVDPQPALSDLENRGGIVITESPQEMAVAQSHLNLWTRIAAEHIPYALILEDDVYFSREFAGETDRVWNELKGDTDETAFDLLYLSFREVDSGAQKTAYTKALFRPGHGLWWLSGYVLSSRGAERLLKRLPIKGPVDLWINRQFEHLDVYATTRPLIFQRRDWRSDNSYSVIPVLRGIRGARGGTVTPKWEADSNGSGEARVGGHHTPVFGIGLSKTGTTSLHEALTRLGYRSCHWQSDEFSDETSKAIDRGERLPFDAYTDVASVVRRFAELDRVYPTAVFILTIRDFDQWVMSRARHVASNRAENAAAAALRHSWTVTDPSSWYLERLAHHERVLRYFHQRPNKLLVMDICGGDGWQQLCTFLRCPIPDEPFPRVDPLAVRDAAARMSDTRIRLQPHATESLLHDDYPWITKDRPVLDGAREAALPPPGARRDGSFQLLLTDQLETAQTPRWIPLTDTFETNLALFRPENVTQLDKGGLRLVLKHEVSPTRDYTAGGIRYSGLEDGTFRYGRFEVVMKPARGPGILTGLFLYRRNPWQEIDLEFLGKATTKMLANVYYNPGDDGDLYNYGMRGTPVLIDLGFDAATDFHSYAIEWDPSGLRWFVDGALVHARSVGCPTPIPQLPSTLHINSWPIVAKDLAGTVDSDRLPAATDVRSITVSSWLPGMGSRKLNTTEHGSWRREASWLWRS